MIVQTRRSARIVDPPHARDQALVEFAGAGDADAVQFLDAAPRVGDQRLDVDVHAGGPERFEQGGAARPEPAGAVAVAAREVIEADADLEDALEEVTDGVVLLDPGGFERLVLLDELPLVEFLVALYLRRWLRVGTA